ncbi:MAG: hypothetical protein ILO34_00085, partial [Kiritimatiellae bacterium]|nr:hypothetical protein [Kiritimatiellia bacterium]
SKELSLIARRISSRTSNGMWSQKLRLRLKSLSWQKDRLRCLSLRIRRRSTSLHRLPNRQPSEELSLPRLPLQNLLRKKQLSFTENRL